jgi:hypothetical protein
VIAAPPEHVYAALVNPEALTAWLPPAGMTGTFERFDARPGGSYRLVLTYAHVSASPGKATAATDIVESRFIDLVTVISVSVERPVGMGFGDRFGEFRGDSGRRETVRRGRRFESVRGL